jgi:nucleoside-diphosphate-sugar epimerase
MALALTQEPGIYTALAREPRGRSTRRRHRFPGWLGNRLVHFLHEAHPGFPAGVEQPRYERPLPGAARHRSGRVRARYPELELVAGDIRDRDAVGRLCARAEGATILHLAGILHPHRVREYYEINTEGTRQLIAAALAAGARRIVATSSNSSIGNARDPSVLFDEATPYRPCMAYGHSKELMEDDVNAFQRTGARACFA